MRLRNITNAFVRLETEDATVVCDPWISPGIFDGGWAPFPSVIDPDAALGNSTHCFISHVHEDHCDMEALGRLPRTVVMLVPDIFPNHVVARRLEGLGFANIVMLPPGEPIRVAAATSVEVIPPMNGFAQEEEFYSDDLGKSAIAAVDAGVIISDSRAKIVLLADNSPYHLEAAGASLPRMAGADLLGFPFNSLADDFPLCYEDMTLEEKREQSRRRNEKRLTLQVPSLMALAPQQMMAYSSDFIVCGPRAREFIEVHDRKYADKRLAAEVYEERTGIPTLAIYEGDEVRIEQGSCAVKRGEWHHQSLQEAAETHYSPERNATTLYPPVNDETILLADIQQAANHMWSKCDQLGIKTTWDLAFDVTDLDRMFTVHFDTRCINTDETALERLLTCVIDSGYLKAHLDFKVHWNNSMISHNLTWRRSPQTYDIMLYKALNFLHKPLTTKHGTG